MAGFAFINYVDLLTSSMGGTSYRYQNFAINETRSGYPYLPFAITTGAGSKGGDRSGARLVVAANPISVNIAAEAAQNNYFLKVRTFNVSIDTLLDGTQISEELWKVAGYGVLQVIWMMRDAVCVV